MAYCVHCVESALLTSLLLSEFKVQTFLIDDLFQKRSIRTLNQRHGSYTRNPKIGTVHSVPEFLLDTLQVPIWVLHRSRTLQADNEWLLMTDSLSCDLSYYPALFTISVTLCHQNCHKQFDKLRSFCFWSFFSILIAFLFQYSRLSRQWRVATHFSFRLTAFRSFFVRFKSQFKLLSQNCWLLKLIWSWSLIVSIWYSWVNTF